MDRTLEHAIFGSRYRQALEQQRESPALTVLLARALDMLDCALVIVDSDGRVEYRNRLAAALLHRSHGGLTFADGTLLAGPRRLREALERAIGCACRHLQPSGLCVTQTGAPPERWLRLVVAPISFGAAAGAVSRAAIWILNTESPPAPREELVAALFGLSRAEARLAIGMLMGRSATECARLAGVGVATIRSQLHSIFTKTGVKRQAQLVGLLSKVPLLRLAGKGAVRE
jgi:DNA-binding CsgD family transcriptional regulator